MPDNEDRKDVMRLSHEELIRRQKESAARREQEGDDGAAADARNAAARIEDERNLDTETREIRTELDDRIKNYFEMLHTHHPDYVINSIDAIRDHVVQMLQIPDNMFHYSVDKGNRNIDAAHVVSTMPNHRVRLRDGIHTVGIQYSVYRGTDKGYYFLLHPVHDWGPEKKVQEKPTEKIMGDRIKRDLLLNMGSDGRLSYESMEKMEQKYLREFGVGIEKLGPILDRLRAQVGDNQVDVIVQFIKFLNRDVAQINAGGKQKKPQKRGFFGWLRGKEKK